MLLWMDGFDHYGGDVAHMLDGSYADASFAALIANAGPGGVGYALALDNGIALRPRIRKVLPGNRDEVGIGYRIFMSVLPFDDVAVMEWLNIGNGTICRLVVKPTGALEFQTGGGTVVWQSGPLLRANSWQHLECHVKMGTTAVGALQVGVDGLPVVNINNIITSSDSLCAMTLSGGYVSNSGFFRYMIKDYFINDGEGVRNNGMLGDRQVLTMIPTGDGDLDDWTPSVGTSGYVLIAKLAPDDTTFIYAGAGGDVSTFDIGDIDLDITSIAGIMPIARVWKSDSGIALLDISVVSNGTDSAHLTSAISTNKQYYADVIELDPHTNAPWTPAAFNAAQLKLDRNT